jgi:GTPase involved in cell partitioning and DNA repair
LDSWESLEYLHEKSRETCERLSRKKLHEESEKSYIDSVDYFLTTRNFDKCRIPEKLQNFSQQIKEIDKYDEKFHEKAGEITSEIIDYVNKIQEEEREEKFRKIIEYHHNIKKKTIISFSLVTVFFLFFYLYYKNKKRNNNFK